MSDASCWRFPTLRSASYIFLAALAILSQAEKPSNCANTNVHVARVARETSTSFSATVVSWRAGHRQPRHLQIVSGARSPGPGYLTSSRVQAWRLELCLESTCRRVQTLLLVGSRQSLPRETSEHRLTNPSWTRWMHLSLPTASLVAPPAKYRRRLVYSSGVAWLYVYINYIYIPAILSVRI